MNIKIGHRRLISEHILKSRSSDVDNRPQGIELEREEVREYFFSFLSSHSFFHHSDAIMNFPIIVRTLTGKVFRVENVSPFSTVKFIKSEIFKSDGISVEMQRLIYAGKELVDNQTMKECNVDKEATFHLVLMQSGMHQCDGSITWIRWREIEIFYFHTRESITELI